MLSILFILLCLKVHINPPTFTIRSDQFYCCDVVRFMDRQSCVSYEEGQRCWLRKHLECFLQSMMARQLGPTACGRTYRNVEECLWQSGWQSASKLSQIPLWQRIRICYALSWIYCTKELRLRELKWLNFLHKVELNGMPLFLFFILNLGPLPATRIDIQFSFPRILRYTHE